MVKYVINKLCESLLTSIQVGSRKMKAMRILVVYLFAEDD
jgi:hypothetical protein